MHPEEEKGGGGRVLQMQRNDCFSGLMMLSHHSSKVHPRNMLLWPLPSFTTTPLTHASAASYLKTIQWRPLLGIVYNADFKPLWLLTSSFCLVPLFSLNLFFFSLSYKAFGVSLGTFHFVRTQKREKNIQFKKGYVRIKMNSLYSTFI